MTPPPARRGRLRRCFVARPELPASVGAESVASRPTAPATMATSTPVTSLRRPSPLPGTRTPDRSRAAARRGPPRRRSRTARPPRCRPGARRRSGARRRRSSAPGRSPAATPAWRSGPGGDASSARRWWSAAVRRVATGAGSWRAASPCDQQRRPRTTSATAQPIAGGTGATGDGPCPARAGPPARRRRPAPGAPGQRGGRRRTPWNAAAASRAVPDPGSRATSATGPRSTSSRTSRPRASTSSAGCRPGPAVRPRRSRRAPGPCSRAVRGSASRAPCTTPASWRSARVAAMAAATPATSSSASGPAAASEGPSTCGRPQLGDAALVAEPEQLDDARMPDRLQHRCLPPEPLHTLDPDGDLEMVCHGTT